ncbi:MAG: 3-keto-disaccharide hydrolase [Bythopirellula sp.]
MRQIHSISSAVLGITVCFGTLPSLAGESGQREKLFNGKDLTGWKAEGDARWEVTDGLLIGRQGPDDAPGDLFTKAEFENFELTVIYRVVWPANTGIWYRYQSPKKAYQADILEYKKPIAYSGTLYCPGKMFLAINDDEELIDKKGWNTMVIRAEGDRHRIRLNGTQVADIRDGVTKSGRIGFQIHAGSQFADMRIVVKEVRIRKL